MSAENRPNPEELLKAIHQEENRKKRGSLKIFLGMAAGVGKTFAMLEEAQRLHRNGAKVVIGAVDTHGRKETALRLEGLKAVPLKAIEYKGAVFEEMDLDAIIQSKPELALVDELAHSNVPGSRHPKRWQDVQEILDNGINVYTTLNVQHIESLKDVVENIAGVTIRETVPDQIIEAAAFIELVDITTDELLQRLKDGKVYLGDQSVLAARNFFQEDRLTALREIVLRYAAEKVDHDLHEMVSTVQRESGWKPRERLLVAVSHSPHSQKLIRTTRRLAFNLDAPWIALHVNDNRLLSEENKSMLSKNIALARDLGAEVITTSDTDIAKAIARVARHRGVTQIIIGRPPKKLFFDFLPTYTLIDDLARECSEIDIHIIRQAPHYTTEKKGGSSFMYAVDWPPYLAVLFCILAFSFLNWLIMPFIGYKIASFTFFLGVLFLSLFFRAGPIIFASLVYAVLWDYFFISEEGVFNEDHVLLLLYVATGIITGILTDRGKRNREMLTNREETAQALYEIAKDIASSPSTQIMQEVQRKLGVILNGKCDVLIKKPDDGLILDDIFGKNLDPKEQATAIWVFENNKEAGWSTTTLSASKGLFLPLKSFHEVVGVLCYHPLSHQELTIEEKNFLYTVGQLLANYLERNYSQERQQKLEHYNKVERVYQTILNLLSQQLEKPLESMSNAMQALKKEQVILDNDLCNTIVDHVNEILEGLFHVLENLSAMAKLSSGLISITKETHSIKDLIDTCCLAVRKATKEHTVIVSIESDLPDFEFDFPLIELLVCNLIINAVDNSPLHTVIEIETHQQANTIILSVSDQGKGIPEDMLDSVFEKFYRIPGTTSPGLGLGLSIGKTIAEIHGGYLKVQNRPLGGAKFSLYLRIPK